MIIVKIVGGLTSQMHKYALGRVLSLRHDVPLKLDLSWFENELKTDTPWPYQLDMFNIKADIATQTEIDNLKGSERYITFARRVKYYLGLDIYKKSYINTSFLSINKFNKLTKNIYLEGEWSGFKYFEGYEEEIKKDFQYKVEISANAQLLLEKIKNENSIALHIRRGDYISNQDAAKFHTICSLSYYLKAIVYIKERVENPKFYIFSDDIQWAKDKLSGEDSIEFVDGNKNFEDLLLMSNCKHNIIANSGFSMWGSWLNQNLDKIVISPTNWVKDKDLNEMMLSFFQTDDIVFIEN